ncbi:membrane-associated HD superfamily phosphohydrolase [Bradyrhizobium sp. S3.12.5]|uniref:hypothetical protein n=1 Tax=Bradyrhizobium sp. S3.12.5 TaxID=3156386 RepID=UPI003397B2D6
MDRSKRLLWIFGVINALSIGALVVLSIQVLGLRGDLSALSKRVDSSVAKVTSLEEKEKSDVDKSEISLGAMRRDLNKAQSDFASMKADLAGTLAKSINKEIIDSATKQAVSKAVIDLTSNNSSKLIDQVAKGMATNYRVELTGPPGKDANDERVAAFLVAQPDFIDAVSVSVLQLQQSRNK